MENQISVSVVRGSDGSVDTAATTQAFSTALAQKVSELETEETVIAEQVHGLYDENLGQPIAMPTIASMVCARLNAIPANHAYLTARTFDYLRANSQGKVAKDGSEDRPNSTFVVQKGKGGGLFRRVDRKEKTSK